MKRTINVDKNITLVSKVSKFAVITTVVFIISTVSFIALATTDTVLSLNYESKVGHHIQEAFNTVSPKASSAQLAIVLSILKSNHLTSGYTNWIWADKCGDIGFWYNTLQQAKADVDASDYTRAWNPEAAKNDILARHYNVLHNTYGDSMSPCNIQWLHRNYIPDIAFPIIIPLALISFITFAVRMIVRNGMSVGYDYNERSKKLTNAGEFATYPFKDAGLFKTWKIVNKDE